MVIILFFLPFYRFKMLQNKSWGKGCIGHKNPIMYVAKGSPLSSIGVKVVRITTCKLLMAPVTQQHQWKMPFDLSWELEKRKRKQIMTK